jgi:hypothetical protein
LRKYRRKLRLMRYRDLEHRLVARSVVIPEGEPHAGCWMWLGRVEPNGYAKVGLYIDGGRKKQRVRNFWVHRAAYEVFKCDRISEDHHVDHRCRFPLCINPNHLEAVPMDVNTHARVKKLRQQNGQYKRHVA